MNAFGVLLGKLSEFLVQPRAHSWVLRRFRKSESLMFAAYSRCYLFFAECTELNLILVYNYTCVFLPNYQ